MSGDVQPRKRKDKKKKKDEIPFEEPRGTSAIFGEGDVFLHSHHDHGTGGHWCAKIIFFSLLAILITLIGLIIIENRGLSELEANSVETRYSGVLEGWLEDGIDDDHHDVHTLELKHHEEDDEDEHGLSHDEDDHDEGDDSIEEDEADNSHEHDLDDEDEEANEEPATARYFFSYNQGNSNNENDDDENDDDRDLDEKQSDELDNELDDNVDDNVSRNQLDSLEDQFDDENHDELNDEVDGDDDNSNNNDDDDDDDIMSPQHDDEDALEKDGESDDEDDVAPNFRVQRDIEDNDDEDDDDDAAEDADDADDAESAEVERLEREEPVSVDLPALPEADSSEDDGKDDDGIPDADEQSDTDDDDVDADDDDADADDDGSDAEDDDFLDNDLLDDEPEERITAPAGKPFVEVDEDDVKPSLPADTLADEEEYERQQEERLREEQAASHVWLKLGVGAALLLATHAVLRRGRDEGEEEEEDVDVREETPLSDRRMTLIPEQIAAPTVPKVLEPPQRIIKEEIVMRIPSIIRSAPTPRQMSMEDEIVAEQIVPVTLESYPEKYSDEEIEEDEISEDKEVELNVAEEKENEEAEASEPEASEPEASEPEDDVEIIEEEELEEEAEEDISDVDDAELLSRLEAKYGSLPARPAQKDGGDSAGAPWPGEPDDPFWKKELDTAEDELHQGLWAAAAARAAGAGLRGSARARAVAARALDAQADAARDNRLLSRAIAAYLDLLKMADALPDDRLLEITNRTLSRIAFRGAYMSAEPVYKILIRRFPDEPAYRNNLTISFLMANRNDLAITVLEETLSRWPDDRVALAHYGFVVKTHLGDAERAADLLTRALAGGGGPADEPRFYYHLGDALLLLGRRAEADRVHARAAAHGHFLSAAQRSLYNVPRLAARAWWDADRSPYAGLARELRAHWREILQEGLAAHALFSAEAEGLRARGSWSQLELAARGRWLPGRCARAPAACAAARAAGPLCRRGQVKFSAMRAGTHVRAHVGPTNCRLRVHLGLSNTDNTYIRVDKEIRQWKVGEVLMFDDSFEHEVWHNGSGTRLVLIVDVWHPDLTAAERAALPAI